MKSRTRNILISIFTIWCVAMLALSPLFVAAHREKKEVQKAYSYYAESILTGHYNAAYEECDSDFQRTISYGDFVNLYQSLEQEYGPLERTNGVTYEVNGRGKPTDWKASIDADFVYQKRSLRFQLVFHKEGNSWLLFSLVQL